MSEAAHGAERVTDPEQFNLNADPKWTVFGQGIGDLRAGVAEAMIRDAPAAIEMFETQPGEVTFCAEVSNGDETISTTVSLPPEQAETFARDLLECAAGAKQPEGETDE
ncbi:hypothetical protein [Halosimplex marinum]|uniref:hypothetical protein n=1 Tax=Halosimplex marinum TaxID=3396620 RepID=UPI003F57CBE1